MKIKVFAASLALTLAAATTLLTQRASAHETEQRIAIVAKRFDFTPGDITVKKGTPVVIALTSQDVDHGLKFKEFNFSLSAKKGETKEATLTPNQAGTFVGACNVFCGLGHGRMKVTLHVTE